METDVKKFFDNILEVLFPSNLACIFCGDEITSESGAVCNKCLEKLPYVEKYCLRCGSPIKSRANYCLTCKNSERSFDVARSPFIYKDMVSNLVQNFKYNSKKYLAKYMAEYMAKSYEEIKKEKFEVDLIVPVPLHIKRQKQRGFNHKQKNE